MFCFKCGKELSDEMMFCPFCGTKMPVSDDESEKGFNEDDLSDKDYDDDEENEEDNEDERLELAREYFKKANEILHELQNNGTTKDLERYIVYLDKAAELGLTEAVIISGGVAETVSKDYKKAEACYKKAMAASGAGSYAAHSKLITLYCDHNEALKIDLGLVYSMSVEWIDESYDNPKEHKFALETYCDLFREPYVDSDITCFEELAKIDNKRYFDLGVELYNKYYFLSTMKCRISEKRRQKSKDELTKAQACMKSGRSADNYRAAAGMMVLKEANSEDIQEEDALVLMYAVNIYYDADDKNNISSYIKLALFYYGMFQYNIKDDDSLKELEHKGYGIELLTDFILTYNTSEPCGAMWYKSDECLLKAFQVAYKELCRNITLFDYNDSLKERYDDSSDLAELIEEKMDKLMPELSFEFRLSILESLLTGSKEECIKKNNDVFKATLADVIGFQNEYIEDEDLEDNPPTSYDKIKETDTLIMFLQEKMLDIYEIYLKHTDEFDDESIALLHQLFADFDKFDKDYRNDNKEYVELLQNTKTSETSETNAIDSINEQNFKISYTEINNVVKNKCYEYSDKRYYSETYNFYFANKTNIKKVEHFKDYEESLDIPSDAEIYMMYARYDPIHDEPDRVVAMTDYGLFIYGNGGWFNDNIKWKHFATGLFGKTKYGIRIGDDDLEIFNDELLKFLSDVRKTLRDLLFPKNETVVDSKQAEYQNRVLSAVQNNCLSCSKKFHWPIHQFGAKQNIRNTTNFVNEADKLGVPEDDIIYYFYLLDLEDFARSGVAITSSGVYFYDGIKKYHLSFDEFCNKDISLQNKKTFEIGDIIIRSDHANFIFDVLNSTQIELKKITKINTHNSIDEQKPETDSSETSEENVSNSTDEQKPETDTCDKPKTDDKIPYILQNLGNCANDYDESNSNYLFKGTYFWHNAEIDSRIRASLLIPSSDNIYMMANSNTFPYNHFSNGLALTDSGIYFRTKKDYGTIKWEELKKTDYKRNVVYGIKLRGVNVLKLASDNEINLFISTLNFCVDKDISEMKKYIEWRDKYK